MNRKSLALLLVVALLAMMVPSFALAAGTVTASLSSSDWKHSLTRGERDNFTALSTGVKVSLDATGGIIPVIQWESSDQNVVYIDTAPVAYQTGKTETEIPALYGVNAGTATITGKVYDQTNMFDVLKTLTLIVTLNVIPETGVKLTKTAYKVYAGEAYKFRPKDDGITVLPNGENGSTYSEDDLLWSVSDPKIISVDKYGWVTPLKKAPLTLSRPPRAAVNRARRVLPSMKKAKTRIPSSSPFVSPRNNLKCPRVNIPRFIRITISRLILLRMQSLTM